jgi:serine/threonine protein kinase
MKQLVEAVSILHSNNLLFRNINLQNIIITSIDSCSIKLINIG